MGLNSYTTVDNLPFMIRDTPPVDPHKDAKQISETGTETRPDHKSLDRLELILKRAQVYPPKRFLLSE